MATGEKTPYEILEVPKDISYVELRTIYRTKIHEHKQKKISAINFRRICRVYETLSDFNKRKIYDTRQEWISELPIDKYTPQQLAAEPDLIRDLKQRLRYANLTKLNAQDPDTGHTPLYTAARAGNIEAVKFLTEQGAEPDLCQRTKSTALHVAAFYGHADIVRCLLESGADYRILNVSDYTAEDEAYNKDVDQVFIELKKNAYIRAAANELDWFRKNGLSQHQDTEYFSQRQTLLHCASKKGYLQLVHWLVEQQSANFDLVDNNGNSPLHLAAYGGHTAIVEYLLNSGCDSTLQNRWGTSAEEEGNKHGLSITSIFQRMRERDMFEMAKKGVSWWFYYYFDDTSTKDINDENGTSLLYYACSYGQYEVAKWLLEHGADVNIRMKNKPRSTPLHGANYRGHVNIVELLLEYRADVNIKNDFGATVFEEKPATDINQDSATRIRTLLDQYKKNLKSEKLIEIHIYDDDGNEESPIAKVPIGLKAGYDDLLEALSNTNASQYQYFSIARRVLDFSPKNITVISAVCRARYTSSRFIDTPIRLIGHKKLPTGYCYRQSTRPEAQVELRAFTRSFEHDAKKESYTLQSPLIRKKEIKIEHLLLAFSELSITDEIKVEISTLFSPDPNTFNIPGCICLFRLQLYEDIEKLIEFPTVSIINEPHARLYTLATPTAYWFTSDTRRVRLPTIDGFHAFVHHAIIIPYHLTLPIDMFIAAVLNQPLISKNNPVPCTSLNLYEQGKDSYPMTAYHGTSINIIRSILLDGLVVPGTLVSCGKRINPPKNHIARDVSAFHIPDFAAAIFLSPSIHYSSHSTYAIPFSNGDQQLIPVLECRVKNKSYETIPCTTPQYTKHLGDDLQTIEWRIKDPANIQIHAVLFITMIDSIAASKSARMTRTT
ncbi:hypothetical protein I4U23_013127 [Adineta vaga]|nr:hypothetical protein I4U23_013127 [Adineta vaga]